MIIYIYSASGCGSSTMGRTLASEMGYDYLDIDDILFKKTKIPYTVRNSMEERKFLFKEALHDNLVVSGWFSDGVIDFIDYFDKLVFLTLDKEIRIERIMLRELSKYGTRILEGGDMYLNFQEFIDWSKGYDTFDITKRSLALHMDFFNKFKKDKIIVDTKYCLEAYHKIYNFVNDKEN